jgi:TonB family protein
MRNIVGTIALIVMGTSSAVAQGMPSSGNAYEMWVQSTNKRLEVIGPQLLKAAKNAKLALPNGVRLAIRIKITNTGRIVSAEIDQESGFPMIDQLAVRLVRSKSPLPRMPAGVPNGTYTLLQPISFFGFAPELGRADR